MRNLNTQPRDQEQPALDGMSQPGAPIPFFSLASSKSNVGFTLTKGLSSKYTEFTGSLATCGLVALVFGRRRSRWLRCPVQETKRCESSEGWLHVTKPFAALWDGPGHYFREVLCPVCRNKSKNSQPALTERWFLCRVLYRVLCLCFIFTTLGGNYYILEIRNRRPTRLKLSSLKPYSNK